VLKAAVLTLWFLFYIDFSGLCQKIAGVYSPSTYQGGGYVYHITRDDKGILYFATSNGVVEFDGSKWQRIDNLADPDFRYIIYKDQKLYISAQNEFGYYDLDSLGNLSYFSIASKLPKSWTEIGESWQAMPVKNRVYFQTDKTIYCYSKDSLKIIPLKNCYVFAIDQKLYASNYYTHDFGPVEKGELIPVSNSSIINGSVYYAAPITDSSYLLITTEGRFFLFTPGTGELRAWKCKAEEVLTKCLFFDAYKVNDELYALGTYEGGLILMNKEGEILKQFTQEDGLPSLQVMHIISGNKNDLWVGTANGIARIDMSPLLAGEPAISSGPIIKKVILNDRTIAYDAFNPDFPYFANFNHRYPDQNISFIFANPSQAGEKIEFSYFLEGFDKGWSNWTTQNKRDFTRLPSGNYTFKVKSRNESNSEGPIASFHFRIALPWYESPIVNYLLIALLIAGLTFALVRLRTNSFKKMNARLEKVVQSRTHELLEKQKNLEKLNSELLSINKALDSFVYHTSHDLKAPLKSILGLINVSKENVNDPEETRDYLNLMEKSVSRLDEFIESVIEYSVNSNSQLKKESVDFEKIIDEVLYDLREFEDFKKITFKKNIEVEKTFVGDPERLKIIFNNLISNSIKYSDLEKLQPSVDIKIRTSNGDIKIDFSDNGIGIEEPYCDKIFEMFFRASEKSKGSGLGLYIVKETVENLRGKITCTSKFLEGTQFEIWLPYNS